MTPTWSPGKLANRYMIPPTPSGAVLSPDRTHRYVLWRIWNLDHLKPGDNGAMRIQLTNMCAFIGLNPSTADENKDDPTIRRCKAFAQRWGFDGMWMLNLWGFRATDPKDLKKQSVAVAEGSRNLDYTRTICRNVNRVVLAWGSHGEWQDAGKDWHEFISTVRHHAAYSTDPMKCLKITKGGQPGHPLYLRADSELVTFPGYEDD